MHKFPTIFRETDSLDDFLDRAMLDRTIQLFTKTGSLRKLLDYYEPIV